ncbi:MAG: Bax inhibitor-1/YccA family protein [Deltaproteobacteria bacterium]|jgi:uncharacterized protein|nr:Bax inhibitor-1/YccA family protein [Deltaproteobacteria bacterium]
MQNDAYITQSLNISEVQKRFITKVYGWMCAALLTTGLVSYYTISNDNLMQRIFQSPVLLIGLIIVELALVMILSAAINKLSSQAATGLFFLYSALTGVTISVVVLVYTKESITSTFLITAGTFGAMSFYGYVTKRDLTSIGNLAFMGLIGIIIASIVNIFIQSTSLYTIITYIGVLVFVGLTAYDTQKIKGMGAYLQEGSQEEQKGAIIGALRLYLDFINLFLMLLRIFGRRR